MNTQTNTSKDDTLYNEVAKVLGTAILRNDRNYTDDLMAIIKRETAKAYKKGWETAMYQSASAPIVAEVPYSLMQMPNLNSIDEILQKLHDKLVIGWIVNDGKPHTIPSHASNDKCTDEAKQALQSLIEDRAREARIDELKKAAAHNNSEYTSDYIEDRIAQLSNSKEGK